MTAWPAELPSLAFPLASQNYQRAPVDTVIREQADEGPPLTRRRTRQKLFNVAFSREMTKAQAKRLDAFYWTDLGQTGAFTVVDALTDQTFTCTFAAPPALTALGGTMWRAQLQLLAKL